MPTPEVVPERRRRGTVPPVSAGRLGPSRLAGLDVSLSVDASIDADAANASGDEASAAGESVRGEGAGTDAEEPPGPGGDAWRPDAAFVECWARRAVEAVLADAAGADGRLGGDAPLWMELSVRLAGTGESRALNRDHRGRDRATNVLSFPSGLPRLPGPDAAGALVVLGDLVACAAVIRREAVRQGKPERAHWAHLIVHGTLHLLGLDHADEASAAAMEAVEIELLSVAGLPDPYRERPVEAQP